MNPVAQAGDRLSLELNKLEDTDGACRAYLVLDNGTNQAVESLRLQLVLFDPEGVINRRLAVQAGPVGAGKTSVRIFDVSGQQCGEIGRILLNDIAECEGPDGEIADCAGRLDISSRADVPFDD
nr:Tat pathway signal sequence domain protein [Methylonatrum kenyense]